MSDARVRELERAWVASGSPSDEEAYLSARRRAGTLDPLALQVAAFVGDPVAFKFLSAELQLAHKPPKTGIARFLQMLPGEDGLKLRAALAALRAVVDGELGPSKATGRSLLEALEAWHANGCGAASTELRAAHEEHLSALCESEWFRPELPPMASCYEVDAEDGVNYGCWVVGLHAVKGDVLDWFALTYCLGAATPRRKTAERAVREAIRDALVPWVLTEREAPASARPVEVSGPSLLGPEAMTPGVVEAVLGAAPPEGEKLKTDAARKVVEAFFVAQGYRAYRGSLLHPDATYRVKVLKRSVTLQEGGKGNWKKIKANQGREILLIDTAKHLLELAARRRG